jgi:hypothetical protein
MRLTTLGAAFALAFCISGSRPACAAPPVTIPFQGALTGVTDGPRTATFTLYDAASAGNTLWAETKTITVAGGRFATALGDTTAFPLTVKFDAPYWVGVKVGADPEMVPRLPLASVPYAMALPNVTVDRATGYVGINTSNPTSTLHVVGSIRAATGGGSGATLLSIASGGGGSVSVLNTSGATRATMYSADLNNGASGGRVEVRDYGGATRASLFAAADGTGWLSADALDFPDTLGEKIFLYGNGTTGNYGIGIQSSLLQIHSGSSSSSIAFGYGASGAFTERMRVTGSGRVGIGTTSPTQALDVRGNIKMNSAGDMYAAGGPENLYLVRGLVDANGAIVAGSGFTVTHVSNGHYTVKFTNAEFDQPPAVALTPWTNQPVVAVMPFVSGTVGQPATFTVATLQNGVGVNCAFSFIATAFH